MRGRLVGGGKSMVKWKGSGKEEKMYVSGKNLTISNYNVPLKSGRVEPGGNTEEL